MVEYEVLQNNDLQVLASTVSAYLRQGWVPKGEVQEQCGAYVQELQRHPVSRARQRHKAQRSWVPWPKL